MREFLKGFSDAMWDRGHMNMRCPECGAVISDLADICPKCHSWIPEGAQRTPPAVRALTRRWYAFVVVLILVLFIYFFVFHM